MRSYELVDDPHTNNVISWGPSGKRCALALSFPPFLPHFVESSFTAEALRALLGSALPPYPLPAALLLIHWPVVPFLGRNAWAWACPAAIAMYLSPGFSCALVPLCPHPSIHPSWS